MSLPNEQKLKASVFYSWQSDLPNATNRGLILDSLERAAKKIRDDNSVTIEPVVDRDTQDVPGAPDIAHTIFQKIERASAFVADVTIINPGLGRPTPNPNVLIELGYALKALGTSRTILVANTANGPVEWLPFDLRTKRVLSYHLPPGADGKPEQRKKLQDVLEAALRSVLVLTLSPTPTASPSPSDKAIESIEKGLPSQNALCNRFMAGLADRVRELTPKLVRERIDSWDDQLVEAIRETLPAVTDFASLADASAIHDSREAALGLFRGFAGLFVQYNLAPGISGAFFRVQFDLPKFIGHELMVTLFSSLIRERRWNIVSELCRETIVIPDSTRRFGEHAAVSYLFASEHLDLLKHRNERLKLNRLSLHADLLKERHETGHLGELSPWLQFRDADVFLYLRSALSQPEVSLYDVWRPWSAAWLEGTPEFLIEAVQREKAEQLLDPLGVKTIPEFVGRLKGAIDGLRRLFGSSNPFYDAFEGLKPEVIGTR